MESKSIPQYQSSLGFFGIYRESIKSTSRNRKLLLPILLIAIFSLSELELYQDYIQLPFLKDFMLQLAQHPTMLHNLSRKLDLIAYRGALDHILEIILVKQLTIAFSSIIKLFFCVAIVLSPYEAYTSKALGPNGMFLKIRTCWKNALVTNFCLFLTYFGILFVYFASYGITTMLVANSWLYLFSGAINLSIPFCYIYGTAIWKVSMVVSVLEEDFCGFKAIGRATGIMKGKRVQASVLMVPYVIASAYVHYMVYSIPNFHLRRSTWLAIVSYLRNGSDCLFNLFMFVVYTVFYHERKANLDQKEVKNLYRPIASGEV